MTKPAPKPRLSKVETPAPETPAPETPAPETPAPETPAPETPVAKTKAPVARAKAAVAVAVAVAVAPTPEDADSGKPTADGMPRRARTVAKARKAAADADRTSLEIARRIVELAEDKKAADIVLLDLRELTTLADYFVVCSGGSERQLGAIADGIVGGMRDEKIRPYGREGTPASHWVLVDFGIVIVHVFTPPERDFYQLEKHWSEARTVLRVQ